MNRIFSRSFRAMASTLSIDSAARLRSGYPTPLLGLGVYKNTACQPACLAALKHGYRKIDTARMYGNEAQVGEALKACGLSREQFYITSKINTFDPCSYDETLAAVDDSLQKLGLEYLDYMLIHAPLVSKAKRLDIWKALIQAKSQGKIKVIGVSNYGVKHLEEIKAAGLEAPEINQIELQPLCQQKEIVDYCKKHEIFIEAYAPLMRGLWDHAAITDAAKKYNKHPAQILVRWSLQRGFSPLPKSDKPERVVSNADVYDFEISAEDMARIDALDRGTEGAITWNPVDSE
ncbi:aldo/keto reductase [Phanerochaete sordida]|uniref:Aldo/keto reductase n=1 Tax=Phanerochaete sordida TaxID=48140 RepID=A0A9P3G485_9APHY|nr:aldo/keto reductase [Phanerochaete sordida]